MSWIFKRFLSTTLLIGCFALILQVHAQEQSGFISIDCGLPENSSYREVKTGITFISDTAFINTGQSKLLPANQEYQPFLHLRSFPDGTRNCYRINVTRGNKYLTRASFFYGKYDEADSERLPAFELHLGPKLWDSVRFIASLDKIVKELIHVPLRNYIHVCLVNTGAGVPFISAIELRPLPHTIYNHTVNTQTGSLALIFRYDTRQATPNSTVYRYPDDVHDRLWYPYFGDYWTQLSTSSANYSKFGNDYRPPSAIMTTAATPNDANDSLMITWPVSDQNTTLYHVNMHFAEVEKLKPNQSRKLTISPNPMAPHLEEFSPHYLSTTTFTTEGQFNYLSVAKSKGSTLPPIINAVELYVIKQFPEAEHTNQEDVDAITSIRLAYKLKMNWQGDPCAPQTYLWQGVKCSYPEFESPRIISLDLSSSGLTGEITSSISNLTMIQTLDLSNNDLAGLIPESLSRLPNLKVLNLNQNNLTGSVPAGLIDKKKDGLIAFLSLCGNPYMSGEVYCEKKKHSPLTLIAAVCGSSVILCFVVAGVIKWHRFNSKKSTGQFLVQQPDGRSRPRPTAMPEPSTQFDSQAQPKPPIQSNPPAQPKIPAQSKPIARPNPPPQSNTLARPNPQVRQKSLGQPSVASGSTPAGRPSKPDHSKKFTKSEIMEITSKKTFLGRGGFGPVYFGTLKNGFPVAVKIRVAESIQGSVEFQNEVDVLMKVHHKNLVALIGYCDEEGMMALVYEYVAGGNLQQRILSPGGTRPVLTWKQRLGIAIDIAHGLVYLHNHCELPIIHRDMKTENILLTERLQAKIADLGLSKSLRTETATHVFTNVKGTPGYLDPEYYETERLNKKSDVYSFGIVLLQLITGRPAVERGKNGFNVNIADRVRGLRDISDIVTDSENIVDAKIQGSYTFPSAQKAIRIAMLCVRTTSLERPDMDSVLAELKANLERNA